MIVVDTSVWINAFREEKSSEARHLSELLDNDEVAIAIPIRIEILSGARRSEQPRLSRTLSALPIFYPSDTTWQWIEDWLGKSITQGLVRCWGFIDCRYCCGKSRSNLVVRRRFRAHGETQTH
jgi:predicted nucleic acid-binding protein